MHHGGENIWYHVNRILADFIKKQVLSKDREVWFVAKGSMR